VAKRIFSSLRPSLDGLLSEDSNVDPSVSQLALQDWSKHGHAWATFASEQALKHADIPSIETIQAYQNLSIYWFAVDQIERANFHEGKYLFGGMDFDRPF
jgi:hypothetical protein